MAEVRHLVANRHHLLIIRHTQQGLLIEPYHKHTHDGFKSLLIPNATADYAVCEDQLGMLHIVCMNNSNQLMHVYIQSLNMDHTGPLQPPFFIIDSVITHSPRLLQLQCIHNSLQLLVMYENSIIQYQLAGVHWSSPTILEHAAQYMSLQMHQTSELSIACVWINQYPDLAVHFWEYQAQSGQWILQKRSILESGWDGHEQLFMSSAYEADSDLILQLLRFPHGKLCLERFKHTALSNTARVSPYQESTMLTPIRTVQTAVCVQEQEELHISWLSEEHLYRSTYNIEREAWGSLQSIAATDPVHWIFLSSNQALPIAYSHWIASIGDWQHLNEQLGSLIDLYYARRDFQASVTYASTSISSLERLTQTKQQLLRHIDELEDMLLNSREQSIAKQQRLEVLSEEREIRVALAELMITLTNSQQIEDEMEVSPSPVVSVHAVEESHTTYERDLKHKVISLFQRMTKPR